MKEIVLKHPYLTGVILLTTAGSIVKIVDRIFTRKMVIVNIHNTYIQPTEKTNTIETEEE